MYGEPGVGKTYLCGTAQDSKATSPMLLIDVEGGTTTLRHRNDIDVVSIRTMDQLVAVINKLYAKPGYYKSVVVDSLTELQKLDMKTLMDEAFNKNPQRNKDEPSQREWTISGNRIRRIVRALRDIECNTIMTALAHFERDTATNMNMIYPSLPGKLRYEIPGFLDCVGYMYSTVEDGEVKRRLQFLKTARVIAKDRTGQLGDLVENPTVPMLWDLIHKKESNNK